MSKDLHLVSLYNDLAFYNDCLKSGVIPETGLAKWKETIDSKKREIRAYNRRFFDHLERPFSSTWHTVYRYDGECGYDFRIIPDNGQTDEELNDFIMETVGYPPICSPYDCTGKRFTRWTHFSRTRSGIALIHCWGTDI